MSDEARRSIMAGLQKSGYKFVTVPDLCGMTVKRKQELKTMADRAGQIVVIACYPRAVRWLFSAAGIEWDAARIHVVNARKESAEQVVKQVENCVSRDRELHAETVADDGIDQWDPWFPVIDYERCSNCRQCLSFCLFGVYEEGGNGRVAVKNPVNCKNNCPACARICPKGAIIFPKYGEPPVNGAEIGNEAELKEKIKAGVDEILGDDVYAALAERRKKAKKLLIREKAVAQAEKERRKFSGQGD